MHPIGRYVYNVTDRKRRGAFLKRAQAAHDVVGQPDGITLRRLEILGGPPVQDDLLVAQVLRHEGGAWCGYERVGDACVFPRDAINEVGQNSRRVGDDLEHRLTHLGTDKDAFAGQFKDLRCGSLLQHQPSVRQGPMGTQRPVDRHAIDGGLRGATHQQQVGATALFKGRSE